MSGDLMKTHISWLRGDHEHCNPMLADRLEALLAERDALEAELKTLTTAGIVEVAVRNPSVMEYMRHWEGRAEKAEAENQRLREALIIGVEYLHGVIEDGCPKCGGDCSSANPPVSYCTMREMSEDLSKISAALAEQEKTDE